MKTRTTKSDVWKKTQTKKIEEGVEMLQQRYEECKRAQKLKLKRLLLKCDDSFESFQTVIEEDWQSHVFTAPNIMHGCVWEAPTDSDI